MSRIITAIIALGLLAGAARAQAPAITAPAEGLAVITAEALLADVTHLTDPSLDGRLAGSPGYLEAARWAADRLAALGLEPGGDSSGEERSYLQWFDIEYNEIAAAPRLSVTVGAGSSSDGSSADGNSADGVATECHLGPDFTARGFTGSGVFTAPVVFVGYGLSQPERGHDDYAGLDVAGKIVLCFKPNPAWSPDSTGWDAGSHTPRVKSLAARAHGAVALLWFDVPAVGGKPSRAPIGSVLHGPGTQPEDFPQLEISEATADLLLGAAGEGARLRALIDTDQKPHSAPLAATAEVAVQARYSAAHPTCNVVGVLRGSDPARAGQALVIGGHLDHVGRQSPELYFPGANDNASGSAAVLRLAEAFTRAGQRPARTVVFVLFSSEESGLEGAKHHAAHPVLPPSHA